MTSGDRTRILGGLLLLMTFASGCRAQAPEEAPGPVTDDIYVDLMTRLLLVDAQPPKGASVEERERKADSARANILADHGVTAGDVLRYADEIGSEPGRMEVLWQRITQQYDSTRSVYLEREMEARSEPKGKLGEEAGVARQGPADKDSGSMVAGAEPGEREARAVPDSSAAIRRALPPRNRPFPRRPIVADSTPQRR